ncbi:MAG TPA: heparan-alpha-glucosaminide N-acetyltransferase domain-containing protein [Actinophytocola sp.]|nr:heparan-alpha-glucosaminide N-acetyltransferase domain-containing protein [Actinophytocola sp.]
MLTDRTAGRPGRLVGLDVARCLALVGMIATHTLMPPLPGEDRPLWHWLASGRASALFAVLAGVSLALMSGGTRPVRGRERAATTAGLAVRALLIAALGLALGDLDSGLAVILAYYGVLFLLGLPFLGLRAPALFGLAAAWLVLTPVASYLLAPHLPPRTFALPTFDRLAEPGLLLSEITVTGYYPVLPWLAYLFAGMAVGRLDLRRRGTDVRLALWGLGVAVGAQVLAEVLSPAENAADFHGTVPPEAGWDLLRVADPHSGTPLDLATTIGSALAVIGICLVVARLLPRAGERALAVAFGAGTMTLSLYSLHVLLHTPDWSPDDHGQAAFRAHALVVLVIGAAFVVLRWSGPLEWLVRQMSRGTAGLGRNLLRR